MRVNDGPASCCTADGYEEKKTNFLHSMGPSFWPKYVSGVYFAVKKKER